MYDSIIIGAGVAGMTAALNILRNGRTVLIFEKETVGGQIASSPRVENFPSIKEISGLDLANNLFDQVLSLGAELETDEVLSVIKENETFKVTTKYHEYESKTVVIACGAEHNKLIVPGIEKNGVSYCALCDGGFHKNEEVSVIGDANTALQYAIMLADICKKVNLCMLFDKFFADKVLVDRFLNKKNIEVYKQIRLEKVTGGDDMDGLDFVNTETNEPLHINSKAVFIAIGLTPKTDIYSELVDREKNCIITNEFMETKTKGLYAIGDCRKKQVRQVTTACNDAAICAFNITTRYLN